MFSGTSSDIGVAVVGAGLMGRWHADACARANARLVATVDANLEAARRLSARYPGCHATTDLEEALANPAVTVLHVCTPGPTHVPIATRALERGRHVLVEKPLAETADATRALLAVADARRRLICPVHQCRFARGVLQARRWLDAVGPPVHLDAVICSAGATGRPDDQLDDIVADILPHPLSLVADLTRVPLSGIAWSVTRAGSGECRISGRADGVSVGILVSLGGRPTRHTMRVIGRAGSIEIDLFHGFATRETGGVSRWRKIARPWSRSLRTLSASTVNLANRAGRREPAYPGLRELVRRFHGAVRGQNQSPISPADTQAVADAREALMGALRRPGLCEPRP